MGIKISQDVIEYKIKLLFPNYIFDFSNYKNTHRIRSRILIKNPQI